MKTNELNGAALDWAVAKCEEIALVDMCFFTKDPDDEQVLYEPSTEWAQGGPIVERENISVRRLSTQWDAHTNGVQQYGPTPLIAAMRCYVASVLGGNVDVPEELK